MSVEHATREQLVHWRTALDSGAIRVGWKIGFNVPAIRQKLGLERPVVGHLTSATLVEPGHTHSLAGAVNPLVEPEIAIQVGPGGTIAGLAPALEVIDMPSVPDDPAQVRDVVAGNIFHRAAAIGRSHEGDSPGDVTATLTVDGETAGSAAVGRYDLEGMLAVVRETLEEADESLEPGDRIIAGTLTPPAAVSPGSRVRLEIGPLGSIEIDFTH